MLTEFINLRFRLNIVQSSTRVRAPMGPGLKA